MREVVDPTMGEGGQEHPAWALIGASRVTSSHGAVLFDSDIQHRHYVTIQISAASRRRDLNHDWLYGGRLFIEVAMSEAQWASFVSSMNAGEGVPCTLLQHGREKVPGMPYEPRLAESMDEVRGAAARVTEEIRVAFEVYREHKTAANLRSLEVRINNAAPNVEFAAESLTKHTENVVQRARADIEAMVLVKAKQLGVEPGALDTTLQLTASDRGTN